MTVLWLFGDKSIALLAEDVLAPFCAERSYVTMGWLMFDNSGLCVHTASRVSHPPGHDQSDNI